MIRLEVNNGTFIEDYNYTPGMTVADLVKQFQDRGAPARYTQFRTVPKVYDPSQNSEIPYDTPLIDGRYYYMSVWIAQEVDDKGISVSKPLQA